MRTWPFAEQAEPTQIADVENGKFQSEWIVRQLEALSEKSHKLTVLDVGAGECPFRSKCEELGFRYASSDFGEFDPEGSKWGLQTPEWTYPKHDFQCDILDIPEDELFDIVLCTEVLEHVADPAAALEKLSRLLRPGGTLVVTVPLVSLIHQAPFYFSSGLSPWWVVEHSTRNGIKLSSLSIVGDFADFLAQELARIIESGRWKRSWFRRVTGSLLSNALRPSNLRRFCSPRLLSSAGFGVVFSGTKI